MALALVSTAGFGGPLAAVAGVFGGAGVTAGLNSGALGGGALAESTAGSAADPASTTGAEGGAATADGFFLHPLKARAVARQKGAVILIIWRVPEATIHIRTPGGRKMRGEMTNDE